MNTVFVPLFFRYSQHPNTLKIFRLLNHAFMTKDDPLKVFIYPILVLYYPNQSLNSMLIH